MPRRPTRTVPTVVVPGWHGSGPDHWQSWLEAATARGRAARPGAPTSPTSTVPIWTAGWRRCGRRWPACRPTASTSSRTRSARCCGCTTSRIRATRRARPGSPWSAPPCAAHRHPEVAAFFPPPLDVDTVRRGADGTVLVAGDDDPYLPEGIAAAYGLPLKMATTIIEGGGHLNADSGPRRVAGRARLVRPRQPRLLLTRSPASDGGRVQPLDRLRHGVRTPPGRPDQVAEALAPAAAAAQVARRSPRTRGTAAGTG